MTTAEACNVTFVVGITDHQERMTQPTTNGGAIKSPKLGHIPTLWNSKFSLLFSKVLQCNSCYGLWDSLAVTLLFTNHLFHAWLKGCEQFYKREP